MPYILGLLIILGIIFSGFSGIADVNGLAATAFNAIKNKIDSIIFPKNQREILIENMASDYTVLDRFFSQSAENILKSQDVSEKDKTAIKEATQMFNKSKENIADLGKMEREDKSIVKSVIEKVLEYGLNPSSGNINPDNSAALVTPTQPTPNPASPSIVPPIAPTVIPPYCRVECTQQ